MKLKKVLGYFMLTAGAFFLGTLLLGAANAVSVGSAGTDANDVPDDYITGGGEDYSYESVSIQYHPASPNETLAVPGGAAGTDANAATDYYISVGGKDYNYESVSVEYRAASQDNSDN